MEDNWNDVFKRAAQGGKVQMSESTWKKIDVQLQQSDKPKTVGLKKYHWTIAASLLILITSVFLFNSISEKEDAIVLASLQDASHMIDNTPLYEKSKIRNLYTAYQ